MSQIVNPDQVREFYDKVLAGDWGPFETGFFCIAARKKYMSQEEREATRLGDTCMMEKTILKQDDFQEFWLKLQKVDAGLSFHSSNNGALIPPHCMVFYINVNKTDMINAIKDFKSDLLDMENELWDVLIKRGSQEGIGAKIRGINNKLLKAYQNPKNNVKGWLDIDMDLGKEAKESEYLKSFEQVLPSVLKTAHFEPGTYHIIRTQGGYHILIKASWIKTFNAEYASTCAKQKISINKDTFIDPMKVITKVKETYQFWFDTEPEEIKLNQNAMVPIPGTLQGGKEVRMLI